MTTDPKKKKSDRLERFSRAMYEEVPSAAYSGLTTRLIADAQPRNALVDRRIYQPPLASMGAMNPEPPPGVVDAMRDVMSDPGRMLPGSGGWTEGVGAALPHVAAATVDPAGALLGGAAFRAATPVVKSVAPIVNHLPPRTNAMMHPPTVPPRGKINPHFEPTGRVGELYLRGTSVPNLEASSSVSSILNNFQNAIKRGDVASAYRILDRETRIYERRIGSSPERDALYDYMYNVLDRKLKLTRNAPGVRSSNSNAPVINGVSQPSDYAPTLGGKRAQQ